MKTKTVLFVLFICTVFFNLSLYAQSNRIIKLEVDTENITIDNIEETATFGQPSETKNKDFTLDVNIGDVIIWQGSSTPSSGGLVKIRLFKHEDGIELLGERRIRDTDDTGVVVGKVVQGDPGDVEKYTLRFEIRKRGSQTWESFEIDPKLQIL